MTATKKLSIEKDKNSHIVPGPKGTRKIDTRTTKGYYTRESKLRGRSHQIDEFRSMNEWTPRMQRPTASSERSKGVVQQVKTPKMVYTTNGRKGEDKNRANISRVVMAAIRSPSDCADPLPSVGIVRRIVAWCVPCRERVVPASWREETEVEVRSHGTTVADGGFSGEDCFARASVWVAVENRAGRRPG